MRKTVLCINGMWWSGFIFGLVDLVLFVNAISIKEGAADIITSMKTHFNVGCIYIIIENGTLSKTRFMTKMGKRFSEYSVMSAFVTSSIKCEHCRPLYTMLIPHKTIMQQVYLNKDKVRARWLLFLSDTEELNKIFSQVYIPINCEFLVAQRINDTVHFKEVYRINSTFPLEVREVGNWTRNAGIQWSKQSFYRRRNNLHGLPLRVSSTEKEVVTRVVKRDEKGIPTELGGYFGKIWRTLEEKMNFSTRFLKPVNGWGLKFGSSWTGIMSEVTRKKADIGLASLTITDERTMSVDFLLPLMTGDGNIFIREPRSSESNWAIFFVPFKWSLWVAVFLTLCGLSLALWVTGQIGQRINRSESNYYDLYNCIQSVYGSFCMQGQQTTPDSWSCRAVYMTSYLVGIIIIAAYSATLTSFLTINQVKLPFDSLKGLLQDGSYTFHVDPASNLYARFINSTDKVLNAIYKKFFLPLNGNMPAAKEGIMNVCTKDKYAYMLSAYMFLAVRHQLDLKCRIVKLPKSSFRQFFSIVLTKDSPYTELFNINLRELTATGQLHRLRNLYWYNDIQDIEKTEIEVSFEDTLPMLAILLSGYLIGTIFLAIERGYRIMRIRNKYQETHFSGVDSPA